MATVANTPRITKVKLTTPSSGPFLVGFRLFSADAIDVYIAGKIVPRSDYVVQATFVNGYDDHAIIVLNDPLFLAANVEMRIEGNALPARNFDYEPTDPSVIQKMNIEFARVWTSLIEAHRNGARSLRIAGSVPVTELPAGSVPLYDGEGFIAGPNAIDIVNAQEYAAEAKAAAEVAKSVVNFTVADLPSLMDPPMVYPAGATILTRAERYSYTVLPAGTADYDLRTINGVLLRVLPAEGNTFNILAFGAKSDAAIDNGPAITRAINAAGQMVAGAVIIPSGAYRTDTLIDGVLSTSCRSLTIKGDGAKASHIYGLRGTFHGLMKITRTKGDQMVTVSDLGLLCDNLRNETRQRPYGLWYTSTIGINPDGSPMPGYGYGARRNFIGQNLFVGGYDKDTPFCGRLQTGIKVEFGRWPLLSNVSVDTGSPWDDLTVSQTVAQTYIGGVGVHFKDCYYGCLRDSRVSGKWRHGVRFEGNLYRPPPSVHADFEGAIVQNCEIVGWPERGISIDHLGRPENDPAMNLKEPGFFVSGSHVHAHLCGIDVAHHSVITILDCNIATTDGNLNQAYKRDNEKHIRLQDVHTAVIANCQFWGQGFDLGDANCTRGIEVWDRVNHVNVDGNHFMHNGVGVCFLFDDTINFIISDSNVWGGRRATSASVYQTIEPRIRIQKRFDNADVSIPRMDDASQYDGQVAAKTFSKGPGYWTQSVGIAEITKTIPGAAMLAGYSAALNLKSSGFESRWIQDQLPSGATFKLTAVFFQTNNKYGVNLGVQTRASDGTRVTTTTKSVATPNQAGWINGRAIVQVDAANTGSGWRPIIQMAGQAGGASDASCQLVYFDVELVRRQNEAFLPLNGSPLAISNGEMTFERVNNTTLRIHMRGMDGTLRSTNLTLA